MSDFDGQSTGDMVNAFEQRLAAFQEIAQSTAGPLGALLQRIALAQQQYAAAAERHGTTVGEAARLIGIMEAAMGVGEWLQSNESDGSVVEIRLDELIEDTDPNTVEHVLPESGGRHRKPEPPECEVA